jgi:hypothetical protein
VVWARDDGVPVRSATNSFVIVVQEVNTGPVLAVVLEQSADELQPFALQLSASDADLPANMPTFSLVSGPEGLAVDETGKVRWVPTEAQGPSTNLVTVKVTDDGVPSLSATNAFSVVVREVNTQPTMAAIADIALGEDQALELILDAADPDLPANKLLFGLVSGPIGLEVDLAGRVRWTPEIAQRPSTNTVVVKVSDDGTPPLSATNRFVVTAAGRQEAPRLSVALVDGDGAKVVLSWPKSASSYVLQTTPTLNLGAVWQPSGLAIEDAGDELRVTVPVSGSMTFYRLAKP